MIAKLIDGFLIFVLLFVVALAGFQLGRLSIEEDCRLIHEFRYNQTRYVCEEKLKTN